MKQLFLTASFSDVVPIFADHFAHMEGKRVTFIPTASVVEKVIFYVNAGKKALEKLGMVIDILELSTATTEEISHKLQYNDLSFFLIALPGLH